MSNYYDYREVGVMVAHKLMTMEGWKVYGYKADQSDGMTDYYSPAHWNGVAEKNGYTLCVNVYGAEERQEIRKYNKNTLTLPAEVRTKIEKLQAVTTDRGATIHEEKTAQEKIKVLQCKLTECQNDYEVIGYTPGHQAHPSKCNWHIEKDGVIIAKGNGILKYAQVDKYYTYSSRREDLNIFKANPEKWLNEWAQDVTARGYYTTVEEARKAGEYRVNEMNSDIKMIDQFEKFIQKIDTTCGGMLGAGEIEQYEKVIVTEYKKENKVVECKGEVKEGQCFILKTGFNYGCYKGLVYRIHQEEFAGKPRYKAYKLNGKLTKECTGKANQNNSWGTFGEKFDKWINEGLIAFCEIKEEKVPYEVEKLVKKTIKAEVKEDTKQAAKEEVKKETVKNTTDKEELSKEELTVQINTNEDLNGLELTFNGKPCEEVRLELKKNGFRYHVKKKIWYAKDSQDARQFLCIYFLNEETQEQPQQAEINVKEEEKQESQYSISYNINEAKKGIEVKIRGTIGDNIRQQLKQNGFTWFKSLGLYIAKINDTRLNFIQEIATV